MFISRYGIRFTCSSLMRIFYRHTCGTNRFRATSKWLRNACTNVQTDQKESFSGSKTGDRAMPEANEKERLQRGKKNQLFLTWCSLERIKLFCSPICNDTVSETVRYTVVSFYEQWCFALRLWLLRRMNNKREKIEKERIGFYLFMIFLIYSFIFNIFRLITTWKWFDY